jgi:N-acetylglucosamine-6-sulfatase
VSLSRRTRALGVALSLATALVPLLTSHGTVAAARVAPDIIVIVTDDQRADTLRYMDRTRMWLPTRFVNALVSNAACCPSRTTMFTGTYSHTNGVWTNGDGAAGSLRREYGGWHRYAELDLDEVSIALALQRAGYRTGHVGKFLNVFNAGSLGALPVGWDEFIAMATGPRFGSGPLAPYYDYSTIGVRDGAYALEKHGDAPADHSTRLITDEALAFLERSGPAPIFLHVGYTAPHSRVHQLPPVPLPQDEDASVKLPGFAPSVNERDVRDKPSFVQELERVELREITRWRLAVARSLYGVDRGIDAILEAQDERDPGLANTFVLFVSDNGRLHGEHRWVGKGIPYEEAIRVPLLVRWPSLPPGDVIDIVGNIDIPETIADVARIPFARPDARSFLDGGRNRYVLEGMGGEHAYCGIRTETRKFVRFATGEAEYYNLVRDPFELRNRARTPAARTLARIARSYCAESLPPGWPRGVEY